jgi:hypothetical protein
MAMIAKCTHHQSPRLPPPLRGAQKSRNAVNHMSSTSVLASTVGTGRGVAVHRFHNATMQSNVRKRPDIE